MACHGADPLRLLLSHSTETDLWRDQQERCQCFLFRSRALSLSCALNLARVFGRLMRCDVTGQRFELALTGSAGAEPWKRRNEQRSLDEEEGFGFSGNLRKSSAATGSAAGSFVFFSVSFFLRFGSCVCACVCVCVDRGRVDRSKALSCKAGGHGNKRCGAVDWTIKTAIRRCCQQVMWGRT